jgi:hypothetical protein
VYYTPYISNVINLYENNMTRWAWTTFSETSLSITATVATTKTNCSTVNGANTVSLPSGTGVYVGMPVTGSTLQSGTVVTAIAGTNMLISKNANANSATATLTFYHANYDVFGYLSNEALALEALAWSDNTTRATTVTQTNEGRYVKNTDVTRLYLGTYRLISDTQTTDTITQRYLFNMYNRTDRNMFVSDNTSSWELHNCNMAAGEW